MKQCFKPYIKPAFALLFLMVCTAPPVIAGGFSDDLGLTPTTQDAWDSLDPEIQELLTWVVGLTIIGLIVVGIVYTMISGGGALLSNQTGNVAGRSTGVSNMFLGVAVIVAAIIVVALINVLAI